MKTFNELQAASLVWLPEHGIGRYPVPKDRPYNESYFKKYQQLADTELGRQLTAARTQLVARHYNGPLLDVGIGAGQFVEARPDTRGYDVNPAGIEWLNQRGLWSDLYDASYPALSFWDSLEHIDRPEIAVLKAERWVFVSVPVFEDGDHVLRSKHFRPDEHIFYWTHDGIVRWFAEQGFRMVEHNRCESMLGRDGIGSYAFRRT
jgi:hypothetical protein